MNEGLLLDLDDFKVKKPPAAKFKDAKRWLEKESLKRAGFLNLREEDVDASEQLVRGLREIKHCLWIGIGGSALGPKSFLEALSFRRIQPPVSVKFLENPDPTDLRVTLGSMDPRSTLVCVVTKSGQTFETWALTLAVLDWLGRDRWKTQVVAITDPDSGPLRKLAAQEHWATLPIPSSIGGRYSIFSAVGYLPMILEGFSAREFVRGALEAKARWLSRADELTPLAYALAKKSKTQPHVLVFPYASRLKEWGAWFIQLWGESLGKKGARVFPLAALGAVDQHSLLQRLQDGANDFIPFFLRLGRHPMTVSIPEGPDFSEGPLSLLRGRSLGDLLEIELEATREALRSSKRLTGLWTLRALEEGPLGELYFSFCVLTALTGHFLRIDPFDQPGVEKTKKAIRLTLSKAKR